MTQTLFYAGQWHSFERSVPVLDPATGDSFTTIANAGATEASLAIQSAAKGFETWSRLNPYQRAKHLRQAADLLRKHARSFARDTTRESGKPLLEAEGEWLVAADLFEWFSEEAKRTYGYTIPARKDGKRMSVIYQPMGVVGAITAWNFPAYNTARVWAAMLAAGCTVVAKPSEMTPVTAVRMLECLLEAGVHDHAINLLTGDAAAIGRTLLDDPVVRKIHLVGSTRVGRLLMDGASKTNTRLSLELGGNAPALIFGDVDVARVAKAGVMAKFRNNGQVCVSPQRFLVHRSIYEAFVAAVLAQVARVRVGPGMEDGVTVGPMISEAQRTRCLDLIGRTLSAGQGRLLAGGTIPADRPAGYFLSPTVIGDCHEDAPVMTEEIFGPVICLRPFDTPEEAIALGNRTSYGLAAYVMTNDLTQATRAAEGLEFGMVGVNEWYPHATEAPFGGWKQSGLGQESGREGILEYLEKKLISVTIG